MPSRIVRNLKSVNSRMIHAETRLPEENRAGRIPANAPGDDEEDRQSREEQQGSSDDVETPLEEPRRPRHPARGQAEQRKPFDRVDPDLRADGLEEPRHQVDLHVVLSNRADELEHLLVAVPRESHDHTIDLVAPDDLADLVRRSEDAHIPQIAARLPWAGIDEADQVDPVLRMLDQLATDELANLTRADDRARFGRRQAAGVREPVQSSAQRLLRGVRGPRRSQAWPGSG